MNKWPDRFEDVAYACNVGSSLFPFTEVGFCLRCNEYYALVQPVFPERKQLKSQTKSADPVQHPWGGAF